MRTLFLFFLFAATTAMGQNTVGLTAFDHAASHPGYNLIFPHGQGTVFLLDNCGRIVNSWEDFTFKPGNGVVLAPNGDLVVCKGRNAASNPYIHAGGGGEFIERRDWDNNLVWQFVYNDSTVRLHHDMALMPNGNVLAIAWERLDITTVIAGGRSPFLLSDGELWPDKIIELEPDGAGGATIVWEWRVWDHLVQDIDPLLPNFDVVSDRPERINANYDAQGGVADWQHCNSIDYNPDLDQIILSVPHWDEIWIIDHSTSTAEAASSSGGLSGKGGDLLFRWGNPATYNAGSGADQQLFFNHDAHWVGVGISPGHPDFGKVAVFNNRVGTDFSRAHLLTPTFDTYEWEYPMAGGTWGPASFAWSYERDVPQDMYSTGLSSVQRLENNNTLLCVGREGYAFEVTPTGDVVWEYTTPLQGGTPLNQGDADPPTGANLTFRMTRYNEDFVGFSGKDLTPTGYIELNPDSTFCELPLAFGTPEPKGGMTVYPNPAQDRVVLSWEQLGAKRLELFDAAGRMQWAGRIDGVQQREIVTQHWPAGIYFVRLDGVVLQRFLVQR